MIATGLKLWAFTGQMDGETVGPYLFHSKPSEETLKAVVSADFEGYGADEIWPDIFRRSLDEVEVFP